MRLLSAAAVAALVALAAAAPAGAALVQFYTPSHNIGCGGDATFLRCDVTRTATPVPPKPRSCQFDWGNAFGLSPSGRARRLCVSDTPLGPPRTTPVLRYGATRRIGPFTCTSRTAGLTCRNRAGHAFFLSAQRVALS